MRLLYMGTPEFAIPSLQTLLDHRYDIAAVVTAPDKPRGRGQQLSVTPMKEFALRNHLKILQPERLHDQEFIAALQGFELDLIVVVAFRILPREVYSLPRYGAFNLHASLLPKYRGAAPIQWAIINGEQETGVTSFFLQDKVDTGSMILQSRVPITPDETAGQLHDRLALEGAEVVLRTVRLIEEGTVQPRQQDDALASPAPKIFKVDCRIDWKKNAQAVHNFIRGLSPHPSSWTMHEDRILKVHRASIEKQKSGQPGMVIERAPGTLLVGTGDAAISILEIQQEGKRRMRIEEFLRGYSIEPGEQLR